MRIAALFVFAVLAAVLIPAAAANASCTSSTPASQTFTDSPYDGEAGLAPEIASVTIATDSHCGVGVGNALVGQSDPDSLIEGDAVGTYLDTDGNAATGSSLWDGADVVVLAVGHNGADLPPRVGRWNGSTFDFAVGPNLPRVGSAGFVSTIDQLGIANPATLGVRTYSIWSGTYDIYGDGAPDPAYLPFPFAVSFSTAAPAPAPPVPAPAPVVPAVPAPKPQSAACSVPSVSGRNAGAARRKLRAAGCRYRIVRVRSNRKAGRVVSTSPRAYRQTSSTVVVRVSRGRGKAHASIASANAYAAAEHALSRSAQR